MLDRAAELRLFLESVTCDLLFFEHLAAGVPPEQIRIEQEVYLDVGVYADIRVMTGSAPDYFVEVDVGYPHERILESVRRKYATSTPAVERAARLIVVVDSATFGTYPDLVTALRGLVPATLDAHLWNEKELFRRFGKQFGVMPATLGEADLLQLRQAIDRTKGEYAFSDAFTNTALQEALLWQLAFWRLRRLRDGGRSDPRAILPPGSYPEVVVLFCDLCSYSSYVRDTRDEDVVRDALTAFSSKSRYRVINDGGMLYQFQGDSVIAFFGVPEREPGHVVSALECARRLTHIGASIANQWQRHIDRIQTAAGVHISLTIGPLQMLSLRPLSRTHMGAVGDAINLAARLNDVAGCGEIVVSNMLYQHLPHAAREGFHELEPVEARNIGRVGAWKLGP